MALHTVHALLGLRRHCRALVLIVLAALAGVGWAPEARAQPTAASEFQVKAAFLYNFAQFVQWPPHALDGPESPLIIGILGGDPFGHYLDELVQGERVHGHPLVIRRYSSVAEIERCHVLFISGTEGYRATEIAAALRGRSILTVCDWEGFARAGGMIRFVTERNRIRLRINLEAARAAGLMISSKLLRSAEQVTS